MTFALCGRAESYWHALCLLSDNATVNSPLFNENIASVLPMYSGNDGNCIATYLSNAPFPGDGGPRLHMTSAFLHHFQLWKHLRVIISKHQKIAIMAKNDMSQIFLKLCVYFPYIQWIIKVDAFLQPACPFPWQPRFFIFSLIWRFFQWKMLELTPAVLTKILKKSK